MAWTKVSKQRVILHIVWQWYILCTLGPPRSGFMVMRCGSSKLIISSWCVPVFSFVLRTTYGRQKTGRQTKLITLLQKYKIALFSHYKKKKNPCSYPSTVFQNDSCSHVRKRRVCKISWQGCTASKTGAHAAAAVNGLLSSWSIHPAFQPSSEAPCTSCKSPTLAKGPTNERRTAAENNHPEQTPKKPRYSALNKPAESE